MKRLLSIDELIEHMKGKGIKFDLYSEDEARSFLRQNNYFMKVSAYRRLYPKCPPESKRPGEYQNLDFAYLVELSTIDVHLRYLILQMCLDIEHFIKVHLMTHATDNPQEDGYEIVKAYLRNEDKKHTLINGIRQHKSGEYCKDLISKYDPCYPLWVLVELISFGDLLHLVLFYEKTYNAKIMPNNKFMNTVRDLRNASAHSNCMINKMNSVLDISKQPDASITHFIKSLHNISEDARTKNLNKSFIYNVVTLLYVYDQLAPDIAKEKRYSEIQAFLNGRVIRHKDYFSSNPAIGAVYHFLRNVIDELVKNS